MDGLHGFQLRVAIDVGEAALQLSDGDFIHWIGQELSEACGALLEQAVRERLAQFDAIVAASAQTTLEDFLGP